MNIVGWVGIAVVVSWLAAWLIRGRVSQNSIHSLQADARIKAEQLKRDMEARLSRVENDLLAAKEVVWLRDHAISERDKLIRQQTDQIEEGQKRLSSVTAERDGHQEKLARSEVALRTREDALFEVREREAKQDKRLAELEVELSRLAPFPANLADAEKELQATRVRLESAQAMLKTQDEENSRLHKRTVELEPLTFQVKDRQARLVEIEGRLAEAVRVRDSEISQLKRRIGELESLPQRYEALEAKRLQLAGELNALRRAKDEEIELLQLELRAIPALQRKLDERGRQLLDAREEAIAQLRSRELESAAQKAVLSLNVAELDQKDSAIGRMHQQLAEMAPLPEAIASHSARTFELERGVELRERELRRANREAEKLRAKLLDWMRLGGALPARDAEIARLRNRLQEIE